MFVRPPRRRSVPALIRHLTPRHPELGRPVALKEAVAMAAREGIGIAVICLPERVHGRLMRVGATVWIHIAKHVPKRERHVRIMHELAHFWNEDPGLMCAYSDDETINAIEEFADIFAWAVTSPARDYVLGKGGDW